MPRRTHLTRRRFLQDTAAAAFVVSRVGDTTPRTDSDQRPSGPTAWYRRAYLWGQTNITEKDPVRYDIAWWRAQWKRTQVQAIIVNAGGIVVSAPGQTNLELTILSNVVIGAGGVIGVDGQGFAQAEGPGAGLSLNGYGSGGGYGGMGGFSWTREKTVIDIGPIEAKTRERETIPLPPIVGGLLLAAGVILLVVRPKGA